MTLTDLSTNHSHHVPQQNNEAERGAGICVYFLIHQQLHQLPDGRPHHQQAQHTPVEAGQGADHLPKAACVESGTSPPEKAGWPHMISCKSGKGQGKIRLGETLHDQGYIIRLYIQPPHTSRGGKGCVCTQAGGTSCFHQCLLGLLATKERVMLFTAEA